MKLLILAVCCFAALSSVACNSSRDMMPKLKYLESYLQERQAVDEVGSRLEQICPGSKVKFENAIDEIKTCADAIDETAETSCSIMQNRMPKCIQPIVKVIKDCLPEKSKELPDFFLKSLLQGMDYICKTDGEHIFELGNTCLYKQTPTLDLCSRKLKMRFSTYDRTGFGVEDLCSTMQYMRPCFKSHLNLSCGSPITREAVLGFYDSFASKCKNIPVTLTNEVEESKEIKVNQLEDFA